ncbi:Crp/Fnr family transcriptional regulator [Arenibaculum pallidiluteum]|uniref:Crp/Fnr family transcriptional regulator n=1 Tax=Arenibaculum pallidiluteum TaxID=2812559 RepID=UPI001A977E81|nr:Crp/Fnr family transcriptional regulator [Arenibaculum pallidiluteum]
MRMTARTEYRNTLLATLDPDDIALIEPHLEPVDLPLRKPLYFANEPIRTVHFVEAGLASVVTRFGDGQTIECAVVGREGMVGVPHLLGSDTTNTECMVQVPGRGWRMEATALRAAITRSPPLRARLLRYAMAFLSQVSQTAACNGVHAVRQRLVRWLLMTHDRGDGDRIPLTQETISTMLGVRRAGVTVAAGDLQKAGLITYGKGFITILDRPGLEAAACECYAAVKDQFRHLQA